MSSRPGQNDPEPIGHRAPLDQPVNWISRLNREGMAGLADRPRCGRPRLGGQRLIGRIAVLLACPGL